MVTAFRWDVLCAAVFKKTNRARWLRAASITRLTWILDLVCVDFEEQDYPLNYRDRLAKGVLYAFVDVEGQGYPLPTELVPLAKIADYRDYDDSQRKKAWAAAQKLANVKYRQRKRH